MQVEAKKVESGGCVEEGVRISSMASVAPASGAIAGLKDAESVLTSVRLKIQLLSRGRGRRSPGHVGRPAHGREGLKANDHSRRMATGTGP